MMNTAKRQEIEQKLVRHLIRVMKKHNWNVYAVFDGEERVKVSTEKEVMDTVFSVDECSILFRKVISDNPKVHIKHSVQIVLGNDGWDAIADYDYGYDDFQSIMENEVDPYADKLCGSFAK